MAWTPTTWDAAGKGSNAALSGGDLVYSTTGYYDNTVKTVATATAGKWYWEVTLNDYPSGASLKIGADAYGASEAGLARDWQLGTLAPGDVIGMALDIDGGTLVFTLNGASVRTVSSMFADVGEVWRPQLDMDGSYGLASATANFGASAFSYSVPAGFESGFGEGVPFAGVATAPTMLGAALVYGKAQQSAFATVPAILGAPRVSALHDFTGVLGDAATRYVMDLITPDGIVRAPISSWQATLQTDSSNYVQCVVPACTPYLAQINTATEFVICRRADLPDGSAIEYEMARAPCATQFDRGPHRHTCTLSGYSPAFVSDENPPDAYDRALVSIRSISSGAGGLRVRCAVDWLLRPGHRAYADGAPLVVDYINYYAPSGGDSYMDVGERD